MASTGVSKTKPLRKQRPKPQPPVAFLLVSIEIQANLIDTAETGCMISHVGKTSDL
jgi:hypothetical protein